MPASNQVDLLELARQATARPDPLEEAKRKILEESAGRAGTPPPLGT